MIVQGLMLAALAAIFFYGLSQRRRSQPLSLLIIAVSLTGAVLVIFPDVTTRVAHGIGVGRGADLVSYCFILISLFAIFNIHLRMRASAEVVTQLAREIAILSASSQKWAEAHHEHGVVAGMPQAKKRGP